MPRPRISLPLGFAALTALGGWPSTALANPQATARARAFSAAHEAQLRPLERAAGLAWWNANISGKDADFKAKEQAFNRVDEALADPVKFRALKQIKADGGIDDPILARCIDVLYLTYLEKQVDPALLRQMVARSN